MRIAVVHLYHETNTFAQEQNDSQGCVLLQEGEELLTRAKEKSCIQGFVEAAGEASVELIPTVGIGFLYGGLIHADVYKCCCEKILNALKELGRLDGIYFDFHGAMVAEDPYTDAEGTLLDLVTNALGDVPMVGTYDFHALMSQDEVDRIVPFPYNTNPHIDGYERGIEAAQCLLRMLAGEMRPVTVRVLVPILGPNIGQSTWSHIPEEEDRLLLYQLNQQRAALEADPGIVNVTILGGYGYADSPDAGMAILATADGDIDLADRTARGLAQQLWDRRNELELVRPIFPIDVGVQMAMAADEGPVLLVDLGDDPGSACPGDSPAVLESICRLGASDCALTIRDPEVVQTGIAAGVGQTITVPVGGKIDSRFYQPMTVTGTVKLIDDGRYMVCGPTHGGWDREVRRDTFHEVDVGERVVLRIDNRIDVIFSQRQTGKDRDFFKSAGIILEGKQIVVVKSNQAHRASFDPIAARTIELGTPGVSTVDYASLPYRKLRRPIWPVDRSMRWHA